ncbi:SusC/RagA family TonB-linked outer membrane protein [Zunongwangia atlantica]|uniref:SusC/RagA family TonB-linked outer membrane protein n=1 Tax=Zunongwangia atlantica TaxID=1502297 RepID=UPI000A0F47D3|nr:TonB-dependent receptor [Zunongwangia atlantica]
MKTEIQCPDYLRWLSIILLFEFLFLVPFYGAELKVEEFQEQEITISGTVTSSEDNLGVPGVNVMIKGVANRGAITDMDGRYTIEVPVGATLVYSFIGYKTVERKVNNQTEINVVLEIDQDSLGEVIIVGYGRQEKASVVGSISQTTGENLQRTGGVTNIGAALTGQLPGVVTTSSTGLPGSEDPNIYIRGQTSWNNSRPLILVDGIERSMNDVAISSVESISVLKDASATAVYGVRGANGVILITTKRGKQGKASINVRANTIVKTASRLPAKYDSYDALMLRNQSIERELSVSPVSWEDYRPLGIIDKYRYPADLTEAERYPNVDWEDVLFQDYALSHNASVNVAGGTELVRYFAAVDYLSEGDLFKIVDNDQGYQPGFRFDRINVRSNLDFDLTKTTVFSTNLFGSNGVQKTPWDFSGNGPWAAAYRTAPDAMLPYYTSTNTYGFYFPHDANQPNSYRDLARAGFEKQTQAKITADFRLKQSLDFITDGLTLEGLYSYDNTFREVDRGVNDGAFQNIQRMWVNPDTGEIIYNLPIDASTQLDFVDQRLWGTNAGSVALGSTYRRQYYSGRLNYLGDFGLHSVTLLGLFSREKYATGSEFSHFREDWVFRGTYNYDYRYFLEFNGAYNGSEKFGPKNRFAFFPSVSGGWMLSNESFMKPLDFINTFKIRASWGRIGDDSVGGRWLYADQWNYGGSSILGRLSSNESPYTYFRNTSMGNPDISWETVEKKNIGVDFSLLDGLISGSFDYFNDHRTDILIGGGSRAIPSFFGGSAPTGNLGEVKSSGYEFALNLSKDLNSDLTVWANINMTHAENEIVFADDPQLYPGYQKSAGYSIGQNTSYLDSGYLTSWDEVLGSTPRQINDNVKLPGDYNIIDFNGDGIIDSYDQAPYGYTGVPQNTFSSMLGVDWKGFNFSMQFYGVSNVTREVFFPTFSESNNNAYVEGDYWTIKDGGDVPLPRWLAPKGNEAVGTRYIYDGSYLRLKTAELGYTFRDGWIESIGMNSCKFYLSGNNLFLWTKMPDDRESNFSGNSRGGAYPTMRRITFGFDVNF